MTAYYLDASALVKRYAPEHSSTWVQAITEPTAGHAIVLSEITLAEVAAALAANQCSPDGLSQEERDRALSRFLQDCDEHFVLIQVERTVVDRAVDLTQRYPLRAYDAIQLANALVTNDELVAREQSPLTFVASDADLLTAAQSEQLATKDPLGHTDLN